MTTLEINEFIEKMEEIGDKWTAEDAERVYGSSTLEEALTDRMESINIYGSIWNTILNR